MLAVTWIVSFSIIIGIGIFAGKAITRSDQWSGGDKTMNAWGVGAVLAAWQIGGMSIVGAAQNGYVLGISGSWYSLASGVYLLLVAIFAKLLRENMPGDSVPIYLENRFSTKSGRLYSYMWVIFGFLYIPMQLKTISSIIQIVLPQLNTTLCMVCGLVIAACYTGFAGMKGSAAIGKVVCIGTYVLLVGVVILNLNKIGGYTAMVRELPENFDSMGNMPTQQVVAWMIGGVLSSIVMQSVLQPLMAAKDAKSARYGSVIGYVFAAPICIVTAIIGMMGRYMTPDLGDGATAFAWTIKELNTPITAGLIFAICTMIIAATMATMMMATGTIITNIYKTQINPNASDATKLKVSRYGTIIFSFATLLPAIFMPSAALTTMFLTLNHVTTGPVSFSIFAGLLWKRSNAAASFWSMLTGVITGVIWVFSGLNNTIAAIYPVILISYGVGITITLLSKQNGSLKSA